MPAGDGVAMTGMLSDVKVLDLTTFLSGPFMKKGAYDMVIQGYGGIMSITG
jgi:crotonobetainyl-CoA:carnitine CoA-transferase CaiB-like acyl-CoA transferase